MPSRNARRSAVRPPPSGYLTSPAYRREHQPSLPDDNPKTSVAGLGGLQGHARQRLLHHGVIPLDTHATRFLYARCPVPDDRAFVSQLAERGVLVMPSSLFHETGWFRIALNFETPELDRALDIIGEEYNRA
ncbi:aminotransferase class I/II-fold pyridoxal phosphate-dependent enzyme [Streptomyces sp. NPDC059496]|uniref:aminotransferase class I/II-fold pyridoxal phosphate-dependent enzyme n=1 Tax=Streptomyces sp. NPDC059496 TaxID=3346851 RepID=UPI00367CBB1A